MDERAFRSIRKRKMVVEDEVDDAEHHHGHDDAGRRPVDDSFSSREREGWCP